MATAIIMPKNGMDMTEGRLIRWLKKVGDKVEKDEPILEIETDKVTMESEAPASGVLLARYVEEGAVVPVLTVLGYIGEAGENVPAAPDSVTAEPAQAITSASESNAGSVYDYDVAVIGGGPAGYVAAIKAAQLGGKVVIFEKDALGGTCLNRGCIPTKAFLKTAEYLHHIRKAGKRGIICDPNASVDMQKVVAHKNGVVKTLSSGVEGLLRSNTIRIEKGEAMLVDEHTITCGGKSVAAEKIILCGGSKAGIISIEGMDHKDVLTSDTILDLTQLPERLCIIGGGVIGCEMACAFAAFGSNVTIVEQLDRLVSTMDPAISETLLETLKAQGVEVKLGTQVKRIEDRDAKPVVVTPDAQIECDKVLLSIGRFADLTCLGNMKDKIAVNRGFVVVNDRMETNIAGIYAAGDVTGKLMLAHAAFKMAETAAMNAMGKDETCDLEYTPSCVYTIPEAAGVGMTEEQACATYGAASVAVGTFPFAVNGRSLASDENIGFVKVVIHNKYGKILGVHIVGADAAEMIAEPAALMSMEVTANEVADSIIHAHPTYSEAFMEACADALGRCIHLPKKSN